MQVGVVFNMQLTTYMVWREMYVSVIVKSGCQGRNYWTESDDGVTTDTSNVHV